MKPERLFNLIAGLTLLLIGAIALAGNFFLSTNAWKLWPLIIVFPGIGLLIPTFFASARRGLGSFFMPGIPVLVTGLILLYASLTDRWNVWATAWTFEVLALALGFALSAVFMRVNALAIPASIIGANGLLLAFCAFTGLWKAWAILWPVEFLSVGIGLLIFGIADEKRGAKFAATILFSVAGAGFFLTSFFSSFNSEPLLRYAVPSMLVITGVLLVGTFFVRDAGRDAAETSSAPDPAPAES